MRKRNLSAVILSATLASSGYAATEIQWWHAMGGALGEKLNQIVADYNASQDAYVVKPVYKGNYTETMTAAIAAFRAKQQPHLVQVFEVGTASMMSAKGAIYPVHELMKAAGQPFNSDEYLSAVTGYYTDSQGNMLSLPFNSSTPVLYYNKTLMEKAGVQAPKTWEEMQTVGEKLQAAGVSCGFTTAWQSWVHLENLSARHNVAFASQDNGFAGTDTQLSFNGPLQVAHIRKMGEWQQQGIFSYSGRTNDGAAKFYSGECAMYTESSAGYAGIRANAKFPFGVAQLPYWQAQTEQPSNTIIGGASLWALQGKPAADYQGVASFLGYLSKASVQADWHQFTGYLPITKAAFDLTKGQGFYAANPGTEVAVEQMLTGTPTANTKGIRLGNFVQIRGVIDEALESVWNGKAEAQSALDTATKRGNELLRRFEKAN